MNGVLTNVPVASGWNVTPSVSLPPTGTDIDVRAAWNAFVPVEIALTVSGAVPGFVTVTTVVVAVPIACEP